MKSAGIKEVMASAMLVDPAKVWVTMRNLRDSDLLTTGARGVNAPDMTYLDAARILIAHIVDGNPGRATPRIVRTFGTLPWANPSLAWEGEPFTLGMLLPDSPTATFEEALCALIKVFAECQGTDAFLSAGTRLRDGGFKKPHCRVEVFEEDNAASITMGAAYYAFNAPHKSVKDWTDLDDENRRLGRQAIAFVNQEVIAQIAQGFGEVD